MKRKILNVAMTGLMLGSGSAFALAPTDTPDLEIWMSGATAQDRGIAQLFTDLCLAGTLDTYQDIANPAKKGAQHSAFFCTLDSSLVPGLTAVNPKVLFHKRSAGGSAQGVNPVAEATAITAMVIDNSNCTLVSGKYDCTIANTGDTELKISDGGVSDVEPAMFVGVNTPSGSSPMTPTLLAKLDVTAAAGLVFNTPVTKTLRNALQQVQFAGSAICDPDGANYAANAETQACMPSLSKNQIAGLLTGSIAKWDAFKVGGSSLTVAPGVTAPSDLKVHICRRVNGSGTQATTNAKMLHVPCTPGVKLPASASNNIAGPVVILNSGSGDVEVCLDDFNDGTNLGGNNAQLELNWAIGVQSTENNVSLSKDYRFIKVNGVAPTIENAATGKYEDWVETSFQWRKVAQGGPTGDTLVVLQKIAADSGKPTIISTNLNPSFVHTWGQGGYLALASNGHAVTNPFSASNPVTPFSHTAGGSPNSCSVPVPVLSKPSDL